MSVSICLARIHVVLGTGVGNSGTSATMGTDAPNLCADFSVVGAVDHTLVPRSGGGVASDSDAGGSTM